MLVVKFNSVDEYLGEMEADRSLITRGIVRVTNRCTASSHPQFIELVQVVSSYVIAGQIVRLEYYVGDFWKGQQTKANGETEKRSAMIRAKIEEACAALELEVRSGSYEAAG